MFVLLQTRRGPNWAISASQCNLYGKVALKNGDRWVYPPLAGPSTPRSATKAFREFVAQARRRTTMVQICISVDVALRLITEEQLHLDEAFAHGFSGEHFVGKWPVWTTDFWWRPDGGQPSYRNEDDVLVSVVINSPQMRASSCMVAYECVRSGQRPVQGRELDRFKESAISSLYVAPISACKRLDAFRTYVGAFAALENGN